MDHVAPGENVAIFSLPSPTFPCRSKAAEISDLIGSDQKSPYEKGRFNYWNLQPSILYLLFYFSSGHFTLGIQSCFVRREMTLCPQPLSFFLATNMARCSLASLRSPLGTSGTTEYSAPRTALHPVQCSPKPFFSPGPFNSQVNKNISLRSSV